MMVIGGRTNQVGENLPLEIYDSESSEWFKFNTLQRFRHVNWALDSIIYVHGGFEHETPNVPVNSISQIDLQKLLLTHQNLLKKLQFSDAPSDDDSSRTKKPKQPIYG